MPKLHFPSNFSTSNLVLDTGMYCGGILAFPIDLSSGISAIMMPLDYKWTPEIVKTRTFMLKRAKTIISVCCLTKRTPRLRPERLKMLGPSLTRPKTATKSLSWPKNQFDRVDSGKEYSISDKAYSVKANGIFCHCQRNILSLLTEYSHYVKRIFCHS